MFYVFAFYWPLYMSIMYRYRQALAAVLTA